MDAKKVAANLRAALFLISDHRRFAQGTYARDMHGHGVDVLGDAAHCFCSAGALLRVTGCRTEGGISDEVKLLLAASGTPYVWLHVWSDYTPHHVVLSVFDKAIAEADRLAAAEATGA
jgi:hypothetical protein